MIWIKRFLILALIALIALQFVRSERNNGVTKALSPF